MCLAGLAYKAPSERRCWSASFVRCVATGACDAQRRVQRHPGAAATSTVGSLLQRLGCDRNSRTS